LFVRYEMRFLTTAVVIYTLSLTCAYYAPAFRLDDSPTALATLQTKADQGQPRDRCFLYAELVSQMTDLAGQQFNSGDSGQASETLKLVRRYAENIRNACGHSSASHLEIELKYAQDLALRVADNRVAIDSA